jgi:hypothetical protein
MVANSFVAVVSFCELVYCVGLSLFWGEFLWRVGDLLQVLYKRRNGGDESKGLEMTFTFVRYLIWSFYPPPYSIGL